MTLLLLLWLALLIALVVWVIGKPGEGGALTIAYFLGLSLIHAPGALALLGHDSNPVFSLTFMGFELTLVGLGALIVGAAAARLCRSSRINSPTALAHGLGRFGWRAMGLGAIAFFLVLPITYAVPSITSVIAGGGTLLVLGFWVRLYDASARRDTRQILGILALLPLLPLATLVTGGFIGFGTYWALSVIAFFYVVSRRPLWFFLAGPVVLLLGLSIFVTYMGQRAGIRAVVWEQEQRTSLLERIERVSTIITEFQLIDLDNPTHVEALADRLNQNILVGVGVNRVEAGEVELAHGATIGLWALVPRAVWPDKPEVAGGSALISEFTGLSFAPGTAVGVGQVLEFYMNFGTPGIVGAFFLLGFILMWLDQGVMRALANSDMDGFLIRGIPGLTLMQPGGNLREIVVAFVASFLAAHALVSLRLLPSVAVSSETVRP